MTKSSVLVCTSDYALAFEVRLCSAESPSAQKEIWWLQEIKEEHVVLLILVS